ncbi:hypothetical protein FVEN_g4563 [Fusarium venenatum]|uniref:Uncharacterized protein n=1 Tax=Fusarium venenatum TaxID=56646 RepID=A0A2L2TR19_9HYPO|nr:uncharacterized protein FVRRES_02538 [Fusarium venenatum]KAG8357745.1 hypothetical protein FVEN_g4563 [Fusarium venenatum]KAH7004365.1 hypothetical protein EDB82DRAFT_520387 [Fusarium venenatum]CEI66026.1 unnamed protein product [Fusarium venenatum]
MTLSTRNDSNVFKEFEIHRRSTNNHIISYFECLGQHPSGDGLPGLLDRTPRENSQILMLKDISISAVQELKILESIIGEIIKQEKPLASSVSPSVLSCTVFCLAVAYALSNPPLSVFFKTVTVVGSAFLTIRLVRKYLQRRQLVPLQHKVQGLGRAFKNGTIRYRDLDEVVVSPLD